ncbi:dickkopf-related protein 3a [Aulostomus maculatus]
MMMVMMQVALLVLSLPALSHGILPEIVDSGISHILQDNSAQTDLDRMFVQVEQEDEQQQQTEDAFHQRKEDSPSTSSPQPHHAAGSSVDQETNSIVATTVQSSDLGNHIDNGCITDEDCGKGRYCFLETHDSKCLPCKSTDVPCTKDEECCGEQLCVWGQCSQNATKGAAGSTCQYQTDCSPDLCCAFHTALLFPVCSVKPIERERCFNPSNHLMELLSWDTQDERPRKHCPCAGDLRCQHLGRGSMCLKREDSSEEDLTDSLYSEIDYVI